LLRSGLFILFGMEIGLFGDAIATGGSIGDWGQLTALAINGGVLLYIVTKMLPTLAENQTKQSISFSQTISDMNRTQEKIATAIADLKTNCAMAKVMLEKESHRE